MKVDCTTLAYLSREYLLHVIWGIYHFYQVADGEVMHAKGNASIEHLWHENDMQDASLFRERWSLEGKALLSPAFGHGGLES